VGEPNARLVSSTEYSANHHDDRSHRICSLKARIPDHVEVRLRAGPRSGGIEADRRAAGQEVPDTRVMRSEVIEMKMRPGGREIDTVATHAPASWIFSQPPRRATPADEWGAALHHLQ